MLSFRDRTLSALTARPSSSSILMIEGNIPRLYPKKAFRFLLNSCQPYKENNIARRVSQRDEGAIAENYFPLVPLYECRLDIVHRRANIVVDLGYVPIYW
jgi:hypothetical protein